jgi:hypothetical protein
MVYKSTRVCGVVLLLASVTSMAMSKSPESSTSGSSLQVIVVHSAEEALEVVASLNKEDDFPQVARQKSIDPTADQGGYLGSLNAGELREELRSALRGIGPGQISPSYRFPPATPS